jgi:hypothetical protein
VTDLHPLIHWKIVKSQSSLPRGAQFTLTLEGLNNVEAAEMIALMVRRNTMRLTRAADVITPDVHGTRHTTMISEELADVEDGFWADTEHPRLRR